MARAIIKTSKHDHTNQTSYWLSVEQRIAFKTDLLVYKTLHKIAIKHHSTRFANSLPNVPRPRTETGKRAISVTGPKFWNSLPVCQIFKRIEHFQIKTLDSSLSDLTFWICSTID